MRIPIAGMGVICAAGSDVDSAFNIVCNGTDILKPLTLFDSRLKQTPLCGQVAQDPVIQGFKAPNRTTLLACAAAEQAMSSLLDRSTIRLGVVTATTVAGITRSEIFYEQLRKSTDVLPKASEELFSHEPAALSGSVCEFVNGDGFHTLSTACSTGLHAIGIAKRLIENGTYDACLAVGSDALAMLTIRGFASLTLLDPNGCRPFDKRRAGISLGEGAGAMLLVHPDLINKCKTVQAYVSGWGASADCYHMTAPHPTGDGAKNAVRAALAEASIEASQIGMIATHGTGTPDNDKAEIKAMQSIFSQLPPFVSMKRSLGHTLAASGILEAVLAVKALQENIVPSTGGYEVLDDEIGVAPCGKEQQLEHVLKNSFGFGGNNAAAIFSKGAA